MSLENKRRKMEQLIKEMDEISNRKPTEEQLDELAKVLAVVPYQLNEEDWVAEKGDEF